MKQLDTVIVSNLQISQTIFSLTAKSEYIAKSAVPGQFLNILVSNNLDPLLRRPISISNVNQKEKTFTIVYDVRGKGTFLLAKKRAGESLSVIGPLGQSFPVNKKDRISVLVGGGIGSPPLLFLANKLKFAKQETFVLIGGKSRKNIILAEEFEKLGSKIFISTEDGSIGSKGFVSHLLQTLILDLKSLGQKIDTAYACGPTPMLEAVSEIAKESNIKTYLSLEAFMGCAIGACKGCAVHTTSGYKMVCSDGPVFNAKDIVWS